MQASAWSAPLLLSSERDSRGRWRRRILRALRLAEARLVHEPEEGPCPNCSSTVLADVDHGPRWLDFMRVDRRATRDCATSASAAAATHSKAVTAVGHSILTAAWHMLQTGEVYHDLGGDYYTRQNPDRITKRLIRQLEALGHHVTLEPLEVAA